MPDDAAPNGIAGGVADVAKSFGVGGTALVGGLALIGAAIWKAPEIQDRTTQIAVLIGSLVAGALAVLVGWLLLRQATHGGGAFAGNPAGARASEQIATGSTTENDVFIAAPMAGFGADEAGRKAAVELVRGVEVALRQLEHIRIVYTPLLARPESLQYETPATAFEAELAALRGAKRYVLILPESMPAGTSVLVTTGIAIARNIPTLILREGGRELPFLLEGAVQSRDVKVHCHPYTNLPGIQRLIQNNGLRLFGN